MFLAVTVKFYILSGEPNYDKLAQANLNPNGLT